MARLAWFPPSCVEEWPQLSANPHFQSISGSPQSFHICSPTGLSWAVAECMGQPLSRYIVVFSRLAAASLGEGCLTTGAVSQGSPSTRALEVFKQPSMFFSLPYRRGAWVYSPCTNEEHSPFSMGIRPGHLGEAGNWTLIFQLEHQIPELKISVAYFPWCKSPLQIDA